MLALRSMHGVRNPSGVVMSRAWSQVIDMGETAKQCLRILHSEVKHVVTPEELLQIFIELNSLDQDVEVLQRGNKMVHRRSAIT